MHLFMTAVGLCFGSFFHVMVSRRDWYAGRSKCDSCGQAIKGYDLIPVVSYLLLKGRCRQCHAKIGVKHLISEVLTGGGFAAASLYFNNDKFTAVMVLSAVVILGLCSISDMLFQEISVLYLYGGILWLAALKMVQYLQNHDKTGLIRFCISIAVIFLVFFLLSKCINGKMGGGDFDVLLMLYMLLGAFDWILCLTMASVLGICVYAPPVIMGKRDKALPLPFVPLMYGAFIIILVMKGGVLA